MSRESWVATVIAGVRGDVAMFREVYHDGRRGPRSSVLFWIQPSSTALPLMRVAASAPKPVSILARRILLRRFGCDVEHGARIAPGLLLAHATGIVISGGTVIESGVKLHQHVTLGVSRHGHPHLGQGAYVYAGAVVVGPVHIGTGARIGANAYVSRDVPGRTKVRGGSRWPFDGSARDGGG